MKTKRSYKILCVVGARPNFMKIAPILRELKLCRHFKPSLLHTGQHYDFIMSETFFKDLRMPKPNIYLGVHAASHAKQTAKIMAAFERKIIRSKPDLVIVVGDVNSTLACALASSKMNIRIAHVEAGLRSFDDTMPEEINRRLTDSISNYLFVSERSGLKNLRNEGIDKNKIFFVGNVMIDTLMSNMATIEKSVILSKLRLNKKAYAVLTLHRPSNVDSKKSLNEVYDLLSTISRDIEIVYPIHPRAMKMINHYNFSKRFKNIKNLKIIKPLGYVDFIKLVKKSRFVLTDSGGIQEETTAMKIPCLTMRRNTERPVTVEEGTNYIVDRDIPKLKRHIRRILKNRYKKGTNVEKWDGRASRRIIHVLKKVL